MTFNSKVVRIDDLVITDPLLSSLQNLLYEKNIVYISPLFGSLKSLIVANFIKKEKQIVVLLNNVQNISEFIVELDVLGVSKFVISLTELKTETLQEKLNELTTRDKFILVASYDLLNCELPPKTLMEKRTTKIQQGGELTYNDLIEYLNLLNYQRDNFVEAPGYYSQRGAIIDFWSYSEKNPVRLEFDGDFLESIRFFEPESQRSIETIESTTLAAALIPDDSNLRNKTVDIFNYLNEPVVLASSYELENLKQTKR